MQNSDRMALPLVPAQVTRVRRVDERQLYLVPWIVGFVLFTAGPFLVSLFFALTDYSLLAPPHWAGLANFRTMWSQDPTFVDAMIVTLRYVGLSVPLNVGVGLAIALLLTKSDAITYAYRTAFYIPSLLGGSVAIAILWRYVFGSPGLVNSLLAPLGIQGPSWISEPRFALGTLIVLNVWQFGLPMTLFVAGLKQIPQELYEVARLDGASSWQRFRSITLPQLSSIILVSLIMQTINAFHTFTPAYVISNGKGGPIGSTLLMPLYMYQQGFTFFHMGYASALAWVLLLMTAGLSGAFMYSARWWVSYDRV